MTTVEYAPHAADNHSIIKRISLPDADAARYYMDYLAGFGIDSWSPEACAVPAGSPPQEVIDQVSSPRAGNRGFQSRLPPTLHCRHNRITCCAHHERSR